MDRVLAWRDRLLGSRGFQRWAARFWPTRAVARQQTRRLFDLTAGFVYSQTLLACVELDVFETVAKCPVDVAQAAAAWRMDPQAAQALLVAATGLGLLQRRRGGRYGLGMLGAALRGNDGIPAMIRHHAMLYRDLADPVALLRAPCGHSNLAGFWGYAGAAAPAGLSADAVAPYSGLMAASQPMIADEVLAAYDVGRHFVLMDVGGGDGSFLRAAAARAPALQLVLFDLPQVATLAESRMQAAGLGGRSRCLGGSFGDGVLPPGADLISFVRVLHDHDDAMVARLLAAARAAMPHGGTVLVAEPMADMPSVASYFSLYLRAMGSGRPRSRAELGAMLTQAGFGQLQEMPTPTPLLARVLVAHCKSMLTASFVSLG